MRVSAFLDVFGFIAVLLRAAVLVWGSLAIGGVFFWLLVARGAPLANSARRLLVFSAFALAATECLAVAADSAILGSTAGLDLSAIAGANFFLWGTLGAAAAVVLGTLVSRATNSAGRAIPCALVLLAAEVCTSHAAARVDNQLILIILTAIHQCATGAWIGGLPYLLLTLRDPQQADVTLQVARRFSRLSMVSVGLLFGAGIGLSIFYIGSPAAIYGTNYGLMVIAKVFLFGVVLSLGAMNFQVIKTLKRGDTSWILRLRRIGEAEIGIGITVVLAAASLTSQPPGADLRADRVSLATIADRMQPKVPLMQTPPLSSLSPSTRDEWKKAHPPGTSAYQAYIPGQFYEPSSPGDIAWSEYNHHWAGLVILVVGVLAVMARFRRFSWAKHWPLAFSGLAVFLLLRADPENWPLGPDGFWESFTAADVTQHRIFVLLILIFAVFEWGVQTGRLKSSKAALVFPGVCALGGALLLTHTHAIANVKEEVLAEMSHLPLALFAVIAGWARWLELRYPRPKNRFAAPVWPVCFALIGIVLLLYREA
ncbi:MAG: CopD family protein [Acidobacteriaceae bacterium]|nr:CopD family protein [Acidobacteriaceae bacterium]